MNRLYQILVLVIMAQSVAAQSLYWMSRDGHDIYTRSKGDVLIGLKKGYARFNVDAGDHLFGLALTADRGAYDNVFQLGVVGRQLELLQGRVLFNVQTSNEDAAFSGFDFRVMDKSICFVSGNGNVGIGTAVSTPPQARLEVIGGPGIASSGYRRTLQLNQGDALTYDSPGYTLGVGSIGNRLSFFAVSKVKNSHISELMTVGPAGLTVEGDLIVKGRLISSPLTVAAKRTGDPFTQELSIIAEPGNSNPWVSTSGGIYYNAGGIGVGTSSLQGYKLSVAGGDVAFSGDLDVLGGDLKFSNGLSGYIHKVGQISFDWGGNYDHPEFHGITSKNESGNWHDDIRINSFDEIIHTLDANDNTPSTFFRIQQHSTQNGEDLFWVHSPDGMGYLKGNLGLGTTSPDAKLSAIGRIRAASTSAENEYAEIGYSSDDGFLNVAGPGRLDFQINGSTKMSLTPDGKLGIGTTNPGTYKLAIEGDMVVRKIVVTQANPFPDFVFDSTYSLERLEDLERRVKYLKHLPGIPSAAEVRKSGLDLAQLQIQMLQKIEELTLYLIEEHKTNRDQHEMLNYLYRKMSADESHQKIDRMEK